MKVILLAAGYGTRLYPLTLDKPKCLLDINGKPVIEYILEKIRDLEEVDEVFIVTNDKFYNLFLEWRKNFRYNKDIIVINDGTKSNEERLGAIGDIYFAIAQKRITDDLLIINADNIFSFDLKKIFLFFGREKPIIGIFDVGDLEIAKRMGHVKLDENKKVIFFKEKDQNTKSSICSTGIYYFPARVLPLIKIYLDEGNSPDRSGDLLEWLYKTEDIYGYDCSKGGEYWFDIGSKEEYEKINKLLKNKIRILVTGGAGFIGSHVADLLIDKGHEVIVVDDLSSGFIENINSRAVFYNIDLSDLDSVKQVFEKDKPDVVYHLAAQIDVRRSVENPVEDAEINILDTLNLLELCVKYNIKHFIFSSTGGAIYGDAKVPTNEQELEKPISPYGCAKLAVEKYLNYYNKIYGLKYTILRYSNVYGPRQNSHGEAGVVAIFLNKMFNNENPVLYGGKQTRDFVYVEDVAMANLLALNDEKNEIYNVGTGVENNIIELFNKINKFFSNKFKAEYKKKKLGEQEKSCLSYEKIKIELGWEPKIMLDEGINRVYSWYKNKSIY